MRSLFAFSPLIAGLALLAACGPAAEANTDAGGGEAAMEAGMSAAEAAQDISCWLRGATRPMKASAPLESWTLPGRW